MSYSAALICVDVQPTFMPRHVLCNVENPAGGLPVADGHKIVPVISQKVFPHFPRRSRVFTRDFHPFGHISLASSYREKPPFTRLTWEDVATVPEHQGAEWLADHAQFTMRELKIYLHKVGTQMLWPDHGLQDTDEAQIHWFFTPKDYIFCQIKGTSAASDSYSGFFENDGTPTGLAARLRRMNFDTVFICGLAGDVCAAWTAVDGFREGFQVFFIEDACGFLDILGQDGQADSRQIAYDRMKAVGVQIITSDQLASFNLVR